MTWAFIVLRLLVRVLHKWEGLFQALL